MAKERAYADDTRGPSLLETKNGHGPSLSTVVSGSNISSSFSPLDKSDCSLRSSKAKRTQVSYNVKDTVEKNLSVYCALNGLSKTEVVTRLITEFLIENGLDPDREPRITY